MFKVSSEWCTLVSQLTGTLEVGCLVASIGTLWNSVADVVHGNAFARVLALELVVAAAGLCERVFQASVRVRTTICFLLFRTLKLGRDKTTTSLAGQPATLTLVWRSTRAIWILETLSNKCQLSNSKSTYATLASCYSCTIPFVYCISVWHRVQKILTRNYRFML